MKERLLAMRPLLLRIVGYTVFFIFWFVTFVYITFPYDRLKETIVAAAEAPRRSATGTTASTMQLTIGSLGPTIWPGIRARDVTATFLPQTPTDHAVTMRMERVTAHVGLLALLGGNVNADVSIEGMGGTINAHVEQATGGTRPGLRELRLDIDHVRAADMAPLAMLVGLPLQGSLSGSVELHVPEGQLEHASGTIRLAVDDLRVGDGHAQYQIPRFGGVTVEQIRAGRLEANITVRDGLASIDHIGSRSPEFQLAIDGQVRLREVFSQSDLNLGVRFQLTDAYRHKSELSGRIMSVMDLVPDLQAARRPDGMLAFRCRGNFDRGISCPTEARGAAPSAGGGFRSGSGLRRGLEP